MKARILVSIIPALLALSVYGADAPLWLEYNLHAATEQNAGNYGEAARLHKLSLEEMQRLPEFPDEVLARQMSNVSTALLGLREYEEALPYSAQAVELLPRINVPVEFKLQVMINHGTVLLENDRVGVAEGICTEALEMTPEEDELPFHVSRVTGNLCLAIASLKQGRFEEAEQLYQTVLALDLAHPQYRNPNSMSNVEAAYTRHKLQAEQEFGELE
jgi:tetratricopeptide (TPR) repeat protein